MYVNCSRLLLNWKSGLKMMWQIPFNVSKCKMGRTNPNHVYSIAGSNIEQSNEERDLGVPIMIYNQLIIKFYYHLSTAISKARRLLRLISINLNFLSSL